MDLNKIGFAVIIFSAFSIGIAFFLFIIGGIVSMITKQEVNLRGLWRISVFLAFPAEAYALYIIEPPVISAVIAIVLVIFEAWILIKLGSDEEDD